MGDSKSSRSGTFPSQVGLMGYFGHSNVGDEAMVAVWVDVLRDLNALDRAVVFTASPLRTERDFGVRAVQGFLPSTFSHYVRGYLGRSRSDFGRTLRAFKSCRALVVGGGSLFHDRPDTSIHLLTLLNHIEWAKRRAQVVLLLGVGLGPVHRAESRQALKSVLSQVDVIAVRDSESREILDHIGVSGPQLHTTADPVFILKPSFASRRAEIAEQEGLSSESGPRIGICIRSIDLSRPAFAEAVTRLCQHVLQEIHASIWFIPMQTGGGEDDRTGARNLADRLGNPQHVHIVDPKYSPAEVMGLIGDMDIVVGEKFHSIVFATRMATPFVAISYAPKTRSLLRAIGHHEWGIDLDAVDSSNLRGCFDRVWADRESIGKELELISSRLQNPSQVNIDLLKHHLEPVLRG